MSRQLLLSSIATIALFFAQEASAVDTKIYSGYGCHNENPGASTIEYRRGTASNRSNERQTLTCPVLRDAQEIAKAEIQIIDANPSRFQHVLCTLGAVAYLNDRDRTDYLVDTTSLDTAHLGDIKEKHGKVISMAFPSGVGWTNRYTFSGSWFSYFLDCEVPGVYDGKASGIFSYRIEEKE